MQKRGKPDGPFAIFPEIDDDKANVFHIGIYVRAARLEWPRRNGNAGRPVLASPKFVRDDGSFRTIAGAKVIIEDLVRWFPRALLLSQFAPGRPELFLRNAEGVVAVEEELPQLRQPTDPRRQLAQPVSVQ